MHFLRTCEVAILGGVVNRFNVRRVLAQLLRLHARNIAILNLSCHPTPPPCAGIKVKPFGCLRNLDAAGRRRSLAFAGSEGMPPAAPPRELLDNRTGLSPSGDEFDL
jgi:hypothetical protein